MDGRPPSTDAGEHRLTPVAPRARPHAGPAADNVHVAPPMWEASSASAGAFYGAAPGVRGHYPGFEAQPQYAAGDYAYYSSDPQAASEWGRRLATAQSGMEGRAAAAGHMLDVAPYAGMSYNMLPPAFVGPGPVLDPRASAYHAMVASGAMHGPAGRMPTTYVMPLMQREGSGTTRESYFIPAQPVANTDETPAHSDSRDWRSALAEPTGASAGAPPYRPFVVPVTRGMMESTDPAYAPHYAGFMANQYAAPPAYPGQMPWYGAAPGFPRTGYAGQWQQPSLFYGPPPTQPAMPAMSADAAMASLPRPGFAAASFGAPARGPGSGRHTGSARLVSEVRPHFADADVSPRSEYLPEWQASSSGASRRVSSQPQGLRSQPSYEALDAYTHGQHEAPMGEAGPERSVGRPPRQAPAQPARVGYLSPSAWSAMAQLRRHGRGTLGTQLETVEGRMRRWERVQRYLQKRSRLNFSSEQSVKYPGRRAVVSRQARSGGRFGRVVVPASTGMDSPRDHESTDSDSN